jgi:rRNA maturation protein Nop10
MIDDNVINGRFTEPCPKCGGSGKFLGYTGRVVGQCFTCKGSGQQTFKNSAEDRAKARDRRATRKEEDRADAERMFREANVELVAWLENETRVNPGFDFPAKMLAAIAQWGGLTENQENAVRKLMVRSAERAAAKKPTAAAPPAEDLDVGLIQAAFDKAIANAKADPHAEGIKWLNLRFEGLRFSPAKRAGRNPGAIYVVDTSNDNYLGKCLDGKFSRSRDCTTEQLDHIREIAKDPAAAAKAYGLKFNHCCICGRELTNPESRVRGIGPICAGRFGF